MEQVVNKLVKQIAVARHLTLPSTIPDRQQTHRGTPLAHCVASSLMVLLPQARLAHTIKLRRHGRDTYGQPRRRRGGAPNGLAALAPLGDHGASGPRRGSKPLGGFCYGDKEGSHTHAKIGVAAQNTAAMRMAGDNDAGADPGGKRADAPGRGGIGRSLLGVPPPAISPHPMCFCQNSHNQSTPEATQLIA